MIYQNFFRYSPKLRGRLKMQFQIWQTIYIEPDQVAVRSKSDFLLDTNIFFQQLVCSTHKQIFTQYIF
jgi:hypothetical protein